MLDDFSGGMNTRQSKVKVKPNQSPNINNLYVDEQPGSLVVRNGMDVAGSTVGPGSSALQKINFMKEMVFDNGTRGFFVSDSSKVLYTTDLQNWTLIKSTLTASSRLRAVQGLGWMLFVNGNEVFLSSGFAGVMLDGTNGYPNVPRGKFPAFHLERFFLFNSSANPSGLDWSDRISTDGIRMDITNINAWPVLNHLDIGQNDGSYGSGLDVYKGQLQMHKANRSIFTLFGTDNFTWQPRRTNAHNGTAIHDSIAQTDNLEYYFAREGVEAYDGGDSVRISDDILPDMQDVVSNLTNITDETWDTFSKFTTVGSVLSNSTVSASGLVAIIGTNTIGAITANDTTNNMIQIEGVGTSSTTGFQTVSTNVVPSFSTFEGFVTSMTLWGQQNFFGSFCNDNNDYVRFTFLNRRTSQMVATSTTAFENIVTDNSFKESVYPASTFDLTFNDIRSGNFAIKADLISDNALCKVKITSFTVLPASNEGGVIMTITTNTASYTTNIATANGLTNWDTFDAIANTGGGNIDWYIRAATSTTQIPGERWTSIMPGSLIPFSSTRTFIQIASTISAVGVSVTTSVFIDKIIAKWNQGGASDTAPIGIEWEKRYLLLITTQASGTNSVIYVKSRITNTTPNAWTKFTFQNDYFKSMAKFNDNLYLGSGSTGTIYRFDYGTNDNGQSINWNYDTPTFQFGKPFFQKTQSEYFIEADQINGGILQIGTSVNDSSYTYVTVDLSGTGHLVRSIKSGFPKILNFSNYRFLGTQLDKPIVLHRFGVIFTDDNKIRVNP